MAKLGFLVSLITKDSDYQMEQSAAGKAAAAEVGVDVQIVYADNDRLHSRQWTSWFPGLRRRNNLSGQTAR